MLRARRFKRNESCANLKETFNGCGTSDTPMLTGNGLSYTSLTHGDRHPPSQTHATGHTWRPGQRSGPSRWKTSGTFWRRADVNGSARNGTPSFSTHMNDGLGGGVRSGEHRHIGSLRCTILGDLSPAHARPRVVTRHQHWGWDSRVRCSALPRLCNTRATSTALAWYDPLCASCVSDGDSRGHSQPRT
jgi:hypothetical protein